MPFRGQLTIFLYKFISDTADGLDYFGVVWFVFEMAAEADDEIVDGSGIGVFLQVPDLFEDHFSRHGTALVFDEVAEQFGLHQGNVNQFVAITKFEIFKVYGAAVDSDDARDVF